MLALILYLSIGFGIYLFVLLVLLYEMKLKQIKGFLKLGYSIILVSTVFIYPVSMRFFYYLTPRQAYLFPITELAKPLPNFILETMFSLDYEWYSNNPERTIELARKTRLKSRYVSYYFNMASASINKLPENLLSFNQYGLYGMFIPYDKETNFISLLFGNELYYLIGDMNASQHFALMANTFSPKGESSRMFRRLVETNIINGEYAVVRKYLKMLNQTIFYRNWASEMEQYLTNQELCKKTPLIVQKRELRPTTDHIKSNPNDFVSSLYFLLNDHPENQIALDYLLCICLLNKDIEGFYDALVKYNYNQSGTNLPRLYQEALIVYSAIKRDKEILNTFHVSTEILKQSKLYEEKYFQAYGKKSVLMKDFGNTYWVYLSFSSQP
ncbi:MAG: hypothetical protein JXA77_04915 [Bacteroidales bacterium]|nr:hypothetical protein [Bacteroidales bacterium]MBN2820388.1 hypothetical protein [Bacteroidales bacterium]